ncbi:MAG: D-cysteine desulfhydrase family protein [candidate division Zixibacteria bacterium]|nr:D-cysteine desulfhydrase family protein [candidate division Zixibacteria bacterium]
MIYDLGAADHLRQLLSVFPRAPVAHLPTPLDDCPRLSEVLAGPRIWIKRDDMTGLALGGNKARQFVFSLGPAISQGCDYLVHGADSQSNHSCQTAAAAAKLGMKALLVIPRDPKSYPVNGNLLLDHLLGAQVKYVFSAIATEEKKNAMARLREQGHKPYDTSVDGAALRAVAYAEGALELCEQAEKRGVEPTAVYVSSSTHTLAGLVVGLRAIGSSTRAFGMGYRVEDEEQMRRRLAAAATECASVIGLDLVFAPEDFEVNCQFARPGFGELSRTSLETMKRVAETEGILLDPVYTAKAMDGLIGHIREGRYGRDESVVFLHTGGLPTLFAYGDELFG